MGNIFDIPPPSDFLLPYLRLPGLRLCLGMTTSDGAVLYSEDLTARQLTINGTPKFLATDSGIPYIELNGTTDYLSIADGTWNSVTKELTILALAQRDIAQPGAVASKLGGSGNLAYAMYYSSTDQLLGKVTGTGVDADSKTQYADVGAVVATWEQYSMRFTPGTSLRMGKNGAFAQNAASIPASIFDSTADLNIGRHPNNSQYLDGRIAMIAICGGLLTDAHITALAAHCRKHGV